MVRGKGVAVRTETPVVGERRDVLVRRTTSLLAGAQLALWGAIGVFAAFGAILGPELTNRTGEVGILFGLYYVGTAIGARVAGRVMDRFGRRPGLAWGYLLIVIAGGLASAAAAAGSVAWLRASFVVVGAGVGAALLGRAAVADLFPPERRGRAVGVLIMAGTVGAVGGPPLGGAVHGLARVLGLQQPLAAPWLLASLLAVSALTLVWLLRPDPRALALRPAAPAAVSRKPHNVLASRSAVVAVVTIAAAQAVMVTFMSVIPALIRHHGELAVTLVVSIHLGAMFAFSPLLGSLLDAWGRRAGLLLGVVLMGAGVLLSLAAPGPLHGGGGLLLIGVGWSAAYLGSTALVSDLTRPEERGAALGAVDLVAGVSAAIGVFGGALLLGATTFAAVAATGVVVLLVPLVLLAVVRPGEDPGGTGRPPV